LYLTGEGMAASTHGQKLKAAWGEWLEGFDWDHYSTLTFEAPASGPSAQRQYKLWVQRLTKLAGAEVSWFLVIERGPGRR
jgi:hypothetical protein